MVLQAYLTRAAIAIAYLYMIGFYLLTQMAQRVSIHFRMDEATVTGKATATHTLGHDHLVSTETCQAQSGHPSNPSHAWSR